jgi:hypothetical protein
MVAWFDGYHKITPEAWAGYDAAMAKWKSDLQRPGNRRG